VDSGFRGPKFADAVAENGVELVGDLNFFFTRCSGDSALGAYAAAPFHSIVGLPEWADPSVYSCWNRAFQDLLLVSGLVRGIVASPFHDSSRRMYIYNKH
jgi:hypothetical protein